MQQFTMMIKYDPVVCAARFSGKKLNANILSGSQKRYHPSLSRSSSFLLTYLRKDTHNPVSSLNQPLIYLQTPYQRRARRDEHVGALPNAVKYFKMSPHRQLCQARRYLPPKRNPDQNI
jgi:hypothetical protein